MNQNELPFEPHDLGGPSGVANKIYVPMLHLEQTMRLSNAETNTVSKQTEVSFHLTHVN
jgi:hypothetical protein